MGIEIVKSISVLKALVFNLWLYDARRKLSLINEFLDTKSRILDVGAGPCSVSYLLTKKGYCVTTLDVTNSSLTENITPIIYDGVTFPFPDKSFATALILTVLHHTAMPKHILSEARRIAGTVIVMEDIYGNRFERIATHLADSIINMEWKHHPHTNRTDSGWKDLFKELRFTLKDSKYSRFGGIFRQAVYVLKA